MDIKGFSALIVGVVVALVLAGATLPVFANASDETKTIFNNSYNRYSQLLEDDIDNFTMTVTWDVNTTKATVTIGDNEPYDYNMSSTRVPLINTEHGMLNANKANARGILNYDGSATTINITSGPITIEVSNGVVTLTDSATTPNTYTWDVGAWLFYPDNDGNYTAVNATTDKESPIYLNSIDDLYFATVINTDTLGFVSGHGAECKFYNVTDTPTYSMSLLTSEELTGYTNVIKTTIGDYVISTDAGTNADDTPFNPFIVMVPRSIDGYTPMNSALNIIMQILPLLAIAGLVTGAVVWFINRKG